MRTILLCFLFAVMTGLSFGQDLKVDNENSSVEFVFLGDSTTGTLDGFEASVQFDPEDLSNISISGKVDAATLNTGVKKRDDHLKSADFFDVETYPEMSFESQSVEKTDKGFNMKGVMKIKDVEKEVEILFTYKENVFKGSTLINAADYGVTSKPEKSKVAVNFTVPVKG